MKRTLLLSLLACLGFFSGCSTAQKYHLDGHSEARVSDQRIGDSSTHPYPTVTLAVGEVIPATTPFQSIMPFAATGYWLGVKTEDSAIARTRPVDGSYDKGTVLEGVAPGRTRAIYGNAASLHHPDPYPIRWDDLKGSDWFWIEVVEPEKD